MNPFVREALRSEPVCATCGELIAFTEDTINATFVGLDLLFWHEHCASPLDEEES